MSPRNPWSFIVPLCLVPLCLLVAASGGCSSSSSSNDGGGGKGGAGHDGGGGTGGVDAAAGGGGQTADGAADQATDSAADQAADSAVDQAADAPAESAGGDAGLDGLLADISKDVVPTDSASSLTLTSVALVEGAAFMTVNTCAGDNTSPALTWTAGPSGTMSYAVTLTDLSIDAVHWVIWDIPATTTSLAAALPGDTALTTPAGAKQVHKVEFFGAGGAYRGPCPRGANHVYQFEVNAIGSATLAGVATPTTEGVKAALQAASLAHGDLDGTSNATPPATDAAGQ